jgi:hypothetical protein
MKHEKGYFLRDDVYRRLLADLEIRHEEYPSWFEEWWTNVDTLAKRSQEEQLTFLFPEWRSSSKWGARALKHKDDPLPDDCLAIFKMKLFYALLNPDERIYFRSFYRKWKKERQREILESHLWMYQIRTHWTNTKKVVTITLWNLLTDFKIYIFIFGWIFCYIFFIYFVPIYIWTHMSVLMRICTAFLVICLFFGRIPLYNRLIKSNLYHKIILNIEPYLNGLLTYILKIREMIWKWAKQLLAALGFGGTKHDKEFFKKKSIFLSEDQQEAFMDYIRNSKGADDAIEKFDYVTDYEQPKAINRLIDCGLTDEDVNFLKMRYFPPLTQFQTKEQRIHRINFLTLEPAEQASDIYWDMVHDDQAMILFASMGMTPTQEAYDLVPRLYTELVRGAILEMKKTEQERDENIIWTTKFFIKKFNKLAADLKNGTLNPHDGTHALGWVMDFSEETYKFLDIPYTDNWWEKPIWEPINDLDKINPVDDYTAEEYAQFVKEQRQLQKEVREYYKKIALDYIEKREKDIHKDIDPYENFKERLEAALAKHDKKEKEQEEMSEDNKRLRDKIMRKQGFGKDVRVEGW